MWLLRLRVRICEFAVKRRSETGLLTVSRISRFKENHAGKASKSKL
jgi:hypothetical protein